MTVNINEYTLKDACRNYRQGKSESWESIKHPLDGRMVLIKIDTIPERTRKKHNIPTAQEYPDLHKIRESQAKKDQEEYNYKPY